MPGIVETELFLVRHGESLGNIERTADITDDMIKDPALTEKGRKQARCLGEYYSHIKIDRLFSSGLDRALETATAVAELQKEKLNIEVHPIFTECGTSTEGRIKTIEEIQKKFPLAVRAEGTEEYQNFVLENKEPTDRENMERAVKALSYIRKMCNKGEKVMVVAHAAFDTNILFAALGLSENEIFDAAFQNTGVSKFVFYKEGTGGFGNDVHMIYHNDHSHLQEGFPFLAAEEK